jgi:hypothetical protein
MKITIEIWQSSFNSEWNCNISSAENGLDETEYWAVDDFCALLNLISTKIPHAKYLLSK